MTPERWRQIEELYQSARERGPAVLEGTDPELRREVERLLAQASQGAILDRPAAGLLADLAVTEASPAAHLGPAGRTIAHYRILEQLGAGGMGVVYKAVDTKLNRLVALKFLPAHMQHDPELKRQLIEEARAASALDHPNIVVIHDIEETGGDLFIAMTYHEGATLREKIAGGLDVKDALLIARQIAAGLAKAHDHGIFHRDIKPSNVIVAKDGVARIIDFGLARSVDITITTGGTVRGTPLYMSPEQAMGKPADPRTDLWSLGAVLYEMLAGRPPFQGDTQLRVMHAVVNEDPPPLRELRAGLPEEIQRITARALRKDPDSRYQSAADMADDLTAALAALEAPAERRGLRAVFAVPAAILILAVAVTAFWYYQRSERRLWAREKAIPEISRLRSQDRPLAAFRLMQEAQKYLSGDPQLAQMAEESTHTVAVRSTPGGAAVEIQDYLSPGEPWYSLGTTPIEKVRIPNGYFRWRVSKPGAGEFLGAPETDSIQGFIPEFHFRLDEAARAPAGMAPVPAGVYFGVVWSLGDLGPYNLPAFHIDRFEVTNRQYQEFVDKGGYEKREYWKERFFRDGKELRWEQAMDLFRDATGRPGPSTWKGGHYPEGQADHPVGGVSWYEAMAYSEFAGKSLPAIAQWFKAAPSAIAKYVMQQSNYSESPAPAGKFQGLGLYGTYDMGGNVAEWCLNEGGGGSRYLLGGGWGTPAAEYYEPLAATPFHRAANAGFRCVRNSGPLPPEALAGRRLAIRDFTTARPAPDPIFQVYKAMYRYDRAALNAKIEGAAQETNDWRKEKATFDAAYGRERMAAYLFIPKRVKPPYQTVVFLPSARVLHLTSSAGLGDMKFVDYVIQSGRAVLYPVIKGTYERSAPPPSPDTAAGRETLIQVSKDLGRSIDYLESRQDFDRNRIAYMGVSMSASLGVIWTAMEERLKAVIFLDGGFFNEKPLPGADQVDFVPRLKAPTLMISGKFDWVFMGKDAMFRMLGTPPADKKAVMLDTAHDVAERRDEMAREVLAWLDKYLGKVN
jgi:dienelactone hydrolase